MIILLVLLFIIIILIDIPKLTKTKKRIKTISIYSFFILTSFLISFSLLIDKAPISPSEIIKKIVETILKGISI